MDTGNQHKFTGIAGNYFVSFTIITTGGKTMHFLRKYLIILLIIWPILILSENNTEKDFPLAGIIGYILDSSCWRVPSLDDTWQWQLSVPINTDYNVSVYEIDLFDSSREEIDRLHKKRIYVVCYFSAGSYEDWRDDKNLFDSSVIGKPYEGWEGEYWLDIRTKNVRDVMQSRLDRAVQKQCDAVEADNVHGYEEETGFPLTAHDQLTYNRFLANEAHSRSLGIALKNDGPQTVQLVDDFDFAVTEEVFQYGDEQDYLIFIDKAKAVFNAEYASVYVNNKDKRVTMCKKSNSLGFRTLILPLDLDDSFRYDCTVQNGAVDTRE
jgi:hypothetical protein